MAGPQEALLVAELEAVQVVGLLGPSLQAREAQAHVDTGVQLLRGEPVHPGQEALAQPLHQRAVHLGYLLGKRPQLLQCSSCKYETLGPPRT